MAKCLNCGIETDYCLCNACRSKVDIEDLCRRIIEYKPGSGENPLWDQIASEMSSIGNFRNVVFALADDLPSPRKEYWKILTLSGIYESVPKNSQQWLYSTYDRIKDSEGLTRQEINRIKGLVLGALFMDYRYEEADLIAGELLNEDELPLQCYYNLADFYSKTRRYDEADEAIEAATRLHGAEQIARRFGKIIGKNRDYREKEAKGKQQYMPNPKENKTEARKAYVEYLASIGIDAELPEASTPRSSIPEAIPKDQYPEPKEIRDAYFDTFVAYDLETTGISAKTDSIIEIGAIKVCNGEVVESQEFVFQEFVRPYKRSVREEVTKLTGITKEDVKDARQMWEVFPDFMAFVGDNVLVGYNNVKFDSRFLVRAGRYSNIIMKNPQFDVMRYAEEFREKLGITEKKISLGTLSRKFGIENPQAHRALADALTTARVYLELKKMGSSEKEVMIDDLLADLDDW